MAGLSCAGVLVAVDGRILVDGVTLSVVRGGSCAVMGRSGAGKSTLLKAIAGLVEHSGRILVDGTDLTGAAPHRRRVGLLFQHPRLFPTMRVVDNVAYPLRLARWPRIRRRAEATRLLAEVGLGDRGGAWPDELSGGEQQRVALARALCGAPAVLLLDEPLTGLDLPQRRDLVGLLQRVRAEREVTWVIVTHDPDDAAALGDTIAVLDAGRLVQHAPVEEVRSRPATAGVAALLGSAQLLRGEVRGGRLRLGPLRLPVDHGDGPATFALGSDRIALDQQSLHRPSRQAVSLPGVIAAAVVRGPHRVVRVDTAAGPVEVAGGGVDRPPGSGVEVWFDPGDLWPIPDAGGPPTPASPAAERGVR